MLDRQEEYIKMAEAEESHWWYKSLHGLVLERLKKYCSTRNPRIVDAGCGTGGLLRFLKAQGYNNTKGFDLSDDGLRISRERGLSVERADVADIGKLYEKGTIDVLVCNDVLCYFSPAEVRKITDNIHRLLSTEGLCLVNLPAFRTFSGIHDLSVGIKTRFTKRDIAIMFDLKKYALLETTYWPFLLSPAVFLARLMQQVILRANPDIEIKSDIDLPPPGLNRILEKIVNIENRNMSRKPWGSSLFVVLKKTG